MDFPKTANADGFAEVNVTSYGGGACVEPDGEGVLAGLEARGIAGKGVRSGG